MRKKLLWAVVAMISVMMSSCGIFGGDPTEQKITEADIIGRWEAPSQLSYAEDSAKIVFVFLNEECEKAGTIYGKWGYTYDEGDDVHEADLDPDHVNGEESDWHGNGWYGWDLEEKTIHTFQMMTISDAVAPVDYTIVSLKGNTMEMKEGSRKTYTLTKVK